MNTVAAVAQHLNVAESMVVRVEEWASVLFAVVKGVGARFVSKKVVKVSDSVATQIQSRVITASFQEVWDYLKQDGTRQGAKLNYRVEIDSVVYTVKEIDNEWRVSIAKAAHTTPFTGIKN